MADMATSVPSSATQTRRWLRIPEWLGVGGAALALLAFAFPWYTAAGGATYLGAELLWINQIAYNAPILSNLFPPSDCAGTLTGFTATAAILAGIALLALSGFLSLLRLSQRSAATFALSLSLYLLTGMGAVALSYLMNITLHTTYQPPLALLEAPYPTCGAIGSYGSGLTLFIVGVVAVAVASLWRTLATQPGAPWSQGVAAALGLFGFLAVPWDLSATPGAVDFANAAGCIFFNPDGFTRVNNPCITVSSYAPLTQFATGGAIPGYLMFYIAQAALLTLVLVLALLTARWRTAGWLRSLCAVSLATGIGGVLSGILLEYFVAIGTISPGAAVVGLAFLLLVFVSGRGWAKASATPGSGDEAPLPSTPATP